MDGGAKRTRVIGLTGGIASGKSTVARILRRLGAEVIDADQLARKLVEPKQPALADIVATFGPRVLDAAGKLDRKRLADEVFSDPERRKKLNAILHPRIAAETIRLVTEAQARGVPVVVYEAALLVENGVYTALDGLIVVSAPPEAQIVRAVSRDGATLADVQHRIEAQAPLAEKVAVADYVIDNAGSESDTRAQVEKVWREIVRGGPRRSAP